MSDLVASSSLKEFFKNLLDDVMRNQRVELADVTEFYLVNLLSEFVATEKLFTENGEGGKEHEPLAVLYHRAMQEDRDRRIQTLRRLGDVSLYKAGFFAESLRESIVGHDYYIQMGGTAYGQVAQLAPTSAFSNAYRELCEKFRDLVDVLEEISARGLISNGPAGALKVYETWQRTRSGRLERVLVDAGLMPKKGGLAN
jgi:hypothetical protein